MFNELKGYEKRMVKCEKCSHFNKPEECFCECDNHFKNGKVKRLCDNFDEVVKNGKKKEL